MVFITEDLIRKRAEHNECIISSLEELSLHQQDIERIEYLDKLCRELKILYLQSNLIPKIENVSRLKKLEYLNLALNNIEKVENLQGCESLRKLDLTVNFVGELTSIESLRTLVHLREIYLTGNPCTEYVGYRQYVIATLPQLQLLDGTEIEKSERIMAVQALPEIRGDILHQQELYKKKREKQKAAEDMKDTEGRTKGSDGRWYTDIDSDKRAEENEGEEDEPKIEKTDEEKEKEFWEEKVAFTPESRVKVHQHIQEQRQKEEKMYPSPDPAPRERRLQMEDGRRVNVNEAKINFDLLENVEENELVLDVHVYKHLETSLCDVDVQPTYIQVTIKGKILQLVLPEEVNPDSSKAQRSQTTGHLVITMPKVTQVIKPAKQMQESKKPNPPERKSIQKQNSLEKLEVDPKLAKTVDLDIVMDPSCMPKEPLLGSNIARSQIPLRENSADFHDNPEVPPLL